MWGGWVPGPRERLGIDCDNVLADMDGYLLDAVERRLGVRHERQPHWPFRLTEALPAEAAAVVAELLTQTTPWEEVPPYPGVAAEVRRLATRYDIFVLTALPPVFAAVRELWLQRHGIPYIKMVVSRSKDKARIAASLGLCAMIEDLGATARQLAPRGIECYLIEQPWNVAERDHPGVYACTWHTLADRLLARPRPTRPPALPSVEDPLPHD